MSVTVTEPRVIGVPSTEALKRAMAGPVNAAGIPVYVSFPYDSGIDDTGGLPFNRACTGARGMDLCSCGRHCAPKILARHDRAP